MREGHLVMLTLITGILGYVSQKFDKIIPLYIFRTIKASSGDYMLVRF